MLNTFQSITDPTPRTTPKLPRAEPDSTHYRKSAFVIMSELSPYLANAGVDTHSVWKYLKAEYGNVQSRAEWSAKEWCIVTARLHAARTHRHLFRILVANSQPKENPHENL